MYVAPNTNVRILKNVPLDNTYRNTLYFANASNQAGYLSGKTKYSLAAQSYQAPWGKPLRVEINAENLYDCNYLMFQNSSFGTKWFYAFITEVRYINNVTSEIEFELDVMQTWYFDYNINPSFVEREHTVTDTIGSNLVPDDLELGDYVYDTSYSSGHMNDFVTVVAATVNRDGESGTPLGGYGGIYSGCWLHVFDTFNAVAVFIDKLTRDNKSDAIISIFMMPSDFTTDMNAPAKHYVLEFDKQTGTIDGYTPKNNKLFTYPYCFLYVSNLMGNSAHYKYEYFQSYNCRFDMAMDMSPNPSALITPLGYKTVGSNYNESMALNGFPQCAYAIDAYKAWLAQNSSAMAVDMLGSAMVAGVSAATGNPIGLVAAAGSAANVASTMARVSAIQTQPPQSRGSQSNTTQVALSIKDFWFYNYHIRAEFAKIIDDYWTVYGYPIHQVKVPERASRPHWNYVKTRNVSITGSVPADDLAHIRSVYDNGTTFWKNGDNVGNYNLDNRPGGGMNGQITNA